MQKVKIYLPLLLGLATVAGIWLGTRLNFAKQPLAMHQQEVKEQKLRQIIDFIDYEYVDEVNTDSLLDITIKELLHKLDPHSSYISVSEVQRTSENMQGSFEGIGIEFTTVRDSLTVLRVIENGPSQKAGIKAGDRIVSVNRDTIAGVPMKNSEYINLLKGPAGSEVNVGIYRPLKSASLTFNITRGTIPLPSIDMAFIIKDGIGIIKVNRFAETTPIEFDEAMEKLKKAGMKSLILDLRENPGGLLYAANKMADHFLMADQLIVYTKNRKQKREDTKATKDGLFKSGKMVVLINENSASASEIVAGALQDNDRATIVGRRSYGKGLVQEEIKLKDGSRIRLTTSRYYTPTGRSIQRPYNSDYSAYRDDAFERYHNGELFNKDSIKVDKEQEFTTPGGNLVYGGGGIVPDVFVPIDTSHNSVYKYFTFNELDNFAFTYVDENRAKFVDMPLQDFVDNFKLSPQIFDDFLDYLNLTNAQKQLVNGERKEVTLRLKAIMGRNLFGARAYYQINAPQDKMILKGLEVLEVKN